MDKQFQDIHITNERTKETKIIREITIRHISFSLDVVIIEYVTNGIKVNMEIPKPYYKITID